MGHDEPALERSLRELLALIRETPGIPMREVQTRLSMGWNSLNRRLIRLVVAELVRVETRGQQRLLFPASVDETTIQQAKARAILYGRMGGSAREVFEAICRNPGLNAAQLAQKTGRPPRTIHYRLKGLVEAGLVRSGSTTRYIDLRPCHPSQLRVEGAP